MHMAFQDGTQRKNAYCGTLGPPNTWHSFTPPLSLSPDGKASLADLSSAHPQRSRFPCRPLANGAVAAHHHLPGLGRGRHPASCSRPTSIPSTRCPLYKALVNLKLMPLNYTIQNPSC